MKKLIFASRISRRKGFFNTLLAASLVLAGFEVIYLVGANAILRSHSLDRWVTGATHGLSLQIGSGWTVWPGRVHVRDLELHFEDYNVQFSVALTAADVDIALWQLPTKTFHLTRVRASGVRYLLRHKVQSTEGNERRLALYPRIPGYSDPPLFQGPPKPPLTDAQYNLWTIQLEDVVASVRELWLLEYHFLGTGSAQGGFRLEPQRDARTDRCTLTLAGRLQVGAQTVASPLAGTIEARLDRHDPRCVDGAQIFEKISFKTDLVAAIPDLRFTQLYADAEGPQLAGGTGMLGMRTDFRHGAWMETTKLSYATDELNLAHERWTFAGPMAAAAEIVKGGRDAVLQLSIATPELRASIEGAPKSIRQPVLHDALFSIGVSANLTRPIRPTAISTRARALVPDLRFWNHALDGGRRFAGGSLDASGQLEWSQGTAARGILTASIQHMRVEVEERTLLASGTADAVLSYDPERDRGHLPRFAIDLPELAVSARGSRMALPGGVRVRAQRFYWQGLGARRFQSRFELESASIEPLLPIAISSNIVRALAKLLLHFGKTHVVVDLNRTPAALELSLEEATSGTVQANGTLRSDERDDDPCGSFFVHDGSFGTGIVLARGETTVSPFVSSRWWRERPPLTSCAPASAAAARAGPSDRAVARSDVK